MAFNPSLPANNAPVVAAELRSQFNGLNDLIAAVPTSGAMSAVLNASTAALMTGVPAVDFVVSDPPTQAEVQAIADMVNALYVAMTRT